MVNTCSNIFIWGAFMSCVLLSLDFFSTIHFENLLVYVVTTNREMMFLHKAVLIRRTNFSLDRSIKILIMLDRHKNNFDLILGSFKNRRSVIEVPYARNYENV